MILSFPQIANQTWGGILISEAETTGLEKCLCEPPDRDYATKETQGQRWK